MGSYADRRRVQLARRIASLDAMEPRSMVTETFGALIIPAGLLASLAAARAPHPRGESQVDNDTASPRSQALEATPAVIPEAASGGGSSGPKVAPEIPEREVVADPSWAHRLVTIEDGTPEVSAAATGWMGPQKSPGGSSAADLSRGGGGPGAAAAAPAAIAGPSASAQPASAPMVAAAAAPASTSGASGIVTSRTSSDTSATTTADATTLSAGDAAAAEVSAGVFSPQSLITFVNFPLYTLDYNDGQVLFPSATQVATPGGSVDLRAQARDATGVTFSWNTSGLSNATGVATSGTNGDRLTFQWNSTIFAAGASSVTLTATDSTSHQEIQTYTFAVPAGTGTAGTGAVTWPVAKSPDLVRADAPKFATQGGSVDATTGAFDTTISIPSYNPRLAPLTFVYDSLAADPRPIVVAHHVLDDTQASPTKVGAQLTFNGTAGSTYYYDTSQFSPGADQQVALQADATALATGRYAYTVTFSDIRGTTTASTATGTATVFNESGSDFGSGWTLANTARIVAATGGVILNLGAGEGLWFTTGSGGAYTSPAGDFSALVKNGDNTYTRTLADGAAQYYATDGKQTAVADRNGLRVTYAYDGSGRLSTVSDPYGKTTTLAYNGSSKLSTVTDPAGRITTFTVTSGKLTGVTLPDSSTRGYAYDGSGRLTQRTDPQSKVLTVTYDSSGRVGGTIRPDLTTESIVPSQRRGWVASGSGTLGSPAPAVLVAEGRASYTDPRGFVTDLRPDWRGMGLTNVAVDALDGVAVADRDANGLATIAVDRLNRITKTQFDSKGNATKVTAPDGSSRQYTYNAFGQVLVATDELTFATTAVYDAEGNLTSTQDPLSNCTTMTYTANGRLATSKDARGNTTSYAYDTQDRLTTTTFPGGSTRLIAYNAGGNATTLTDERGSVSTISYDAMGRETGVTDALGNRTTLAYDASGNETSIKAPLSRTTTLAYDTMNRLTTLTNALGNVTKYGYDASGNAASVTDALSRTTTTIYDALNRPYVTVDAASKRTTTTYDAAGQVSAVKDALSHSTTYAYNARGWLTSTTDALSHITATFVYNLAGGVTSKTLPATSNGNPGGSQPGPGTVPVTTTYTLDALGRATTIRDSLNNATTLAYDGVGSVTSRVDANLGATTFTYDSRDRLQTSTDGLGNVTTYQYDDAGNRTVVVDPLLHRTTTAYDALGRPTTVTDARGGVTTTLYDAAGRRTGLIDPASNRTTWAYDAGDRLTTMTDPLVNSATYAYDAADELVDQTDRSGRRTTFAYDPVGRRVGERWLNSGGTTVRTVTTTYDDAGRLTGMADPDSLLTFTYDAADRQLTAATSGAGGQPAVTLGATYNSAGTRLTLGDDYAANPGVVAYSYDANYRLTTISASYGGFSGPRVILGYDTGGRKTSVSRTIGGGGTAVSTTLAYDSADRLTTLTHRVVGGSTLATYTYGYDAASRLTRETNAEGGVTYTYDDSDELTGATGARTESYTYDANGNRTLAGYTTGTNNRLLASPGATYTYDPVGNLSAKTETGTGKVTTYSYDYRNRLTGVTQKSSGGTVLNQATYTYDALDRRIGTRENSAQTWTVYDGQNTYADFNSSGTLTARYVYGAAVDELLARTDGSGVTAWYLTDKLGTVRDVASTSGTVIFHAAYDSFGKQTATTGSGGDRFGFTGRETSFATGLQYNRNRNYDPTIGRWIQLDPISFDGGLTNLYGYVGNNVTGKVDPLGTDGTDSEKLENTALQGRIGLMELGPTVAWNGWAFGSEAMRFGQEFAQRNNDPGAAEAARHALWQGFLLQNFTQKDATTIGNIHETYGKYDPKDSARDQYNNAIGQKIAQHNLDNEGILSFLNPYRDFDRIDALKDSIQDAYDQGKFITDLKDPRLTEQMIQEEAERQARERAKDGYPRTR